jgi:hypothetical protein
VSQGDCINSIAFDNGFFWETLWNDGGNSSLKSKRKDPNVLMEGDVVHIPDLTVKEVSCATEQNHKFKRKGVPAKLNLQFMLDGKARANIPFTIIIDGVSQDGSTDGSGWVRISIPPDASDGKLVLKPSGQPTEEYALALGNLPPIDSVAGQKSRLINLGYFSGDVSDDKTPDFTEAISAFQKSCGLTATGTADSNTQQQLKTLHGS